jgi:hypothetical protein
MSNTYKKISENVKQNKILQLDNIFKEVFKRTNKSNPVNNLQDYRNICVLVWTIPKTGTMTLSQSFQHTIDGTTLFKNVSHCHTERCWYAHHKMLDQNNFNFNLFIDYLNCFKIKPLVVQSYREPISRIISAYFQINRVIGVNNKQLPKLLNKIVDFLNKEGPVFNYYKNFIPFNNFNKHLGYGFDEGENYDVLYTRIDKINDLPKNIKMIDQLKRYHNLKIIKTNERKNAIYDYVKNNIKIPRNIVNKLYDQEKELLEFYYTDDEINQFKNDPRIID